MSLFDSASLVVTPSGYKEDKLYSIKPTDGSGDLVVTRATTATRVNSAGLVELVPYNIYTYSEQFSNAVWDKVSVTVTPDTTVSPNGSTTADTLVISSSGYLYRQIDYTSVVGDSITMSIYTKNSDANFLRFANSTIAGTDSNQIINVGNGWYRHIVTRTFTTATTGIIQFLLGFSFTGNYYIWGAQLVTGTSAKEYFPTTDRLNVPRLDYTNSSCPSILVEPQRTNLALYSSQFDNAAWSKGTITTITANTVISPDGTQNADTVTCNGSGVLFTRQITYLATTAKCSNSIYAKKGNTRYFGFRNFGDSGGKHDVFDFDTKTWTQNTSAVLSYEELDNGWFRLKSVNSDVLGNYFFSFFPTENTSGEEVDTVNNKNVYVWGAQAELGSYATSYIPTVASTVTRNADNIFKTGISSLIGQTEGTMYLDFVCRNNSTFQLLSQIKNASGPNAQIDLRWADGGLYALGNNNGSNQFYLSVGSVSVGSRYKIAIAYKNNDVVVYKNGVQVATDTSCTFIDQSMSSFSYAENLNTYIEAMSVNTSLLFKTRLTNTELEQLTTI